VADDGRTGHFTAWLIGSGSLVSACGGLLSANGHDIQAVISTEVGAVAWAHDHDIPCFPRMAEAPLDRRPHYLFSITNELILSADDLAVPTESAINFHSSLLPRYAGVAQTSWAIVNGEREHGVTWHRMTVQVDGGDILVQERFPIDEDETQLSLNIKCFDHGLRAFEVLLKQLESGDVRPRCQEGVGRSYYSRSDRLPHTGVVTWDRSAEELDRWSRAGRSGPFDNAFGVVKILYRGEVILVREARSTGRRSTAAPGTVTNIDASGLSIATVTADLTATDLTTTGGKRLDPFECARDAGIVVGTVLSDPAPEELRRIDEIARRAARFEPYWVDRLERAAIPPGRPGRRYALAHTMLAPTALAADPATLRAALFCAWQRHSGLRNGASGAVMWSPGQVQELVGELWRHWSPVLPVPVIAASVLFREAVDRLSDELAGAQRRGTFLRDVAGRYPSCHIGDPPRVSLVIADEATPAETMAVDTELLVVQRGNGRLAVWGPAEVNPFEVAQRFMALVAFVEREWK
jgi:methionyl-tRNA formyltransferase